MLSVRTAVVSLAAVLVLSGCASTTKRMAPPRAQAVAPASAPLVVAVESVVDRRPAPNLALEKNGYGWVTGWVLPAASVPAAVRASLVQSLRASGHDLADASTAGAWKLRVEVVQWLAEPASADSETMSWDVVGEARLAVTATSPDGDVHARTFVGHGHKQTAAAPAAEDLSEVLELALQEGLSEIVIGIEQLATGEQGS